MKKTIVYLILIILAICCTKEVIIVPPKNNTRIVLNGFIKPESRILLNASITAGIFDTSNYVVSNMKILLFENDLLVDTLTDLGDGNYISNIFPTYTNNYKVITQYNGEEILASDYLPDNFKFINIAECNNIYTDAEGSKYTSIKIRILDNKECINYYSVKIIFKNEYHERSLHIFSYNQIIKSEGLGSYYPHELVFKNTIFTQDTTEIQVNYFIPSQSAHSLIVQVKKTSHSYYLYKKQLMKHLYNQNGDIWDGVGDPVQMYTNIEGGYGIFAGYIQIIDTIYK
jgi:hypothetical protein